MSAELLLVVQLAVGLVFLRSGLGKLSDARTFFAGLGEYDFLPQRLIAPSGIAIIAAEAVVAFAHLSGWMLTTILPLALGLLTVFLLVAAFTLQRKVSVPCLCFGAGDGELLSMHSVARIALLLAAEALLASQAFVGVRWPMPYQTQAGDLIIAVACAGLAAMTSSWALTLPELVALARRCSACAAKSQQL